MESDGDFVIAWQGSTDGAGLGIFGRRFTSSGKGDEVEFQVNAYTTGIQSRPALAWDGDGDFAVAWSSSGQDGDSGGVLARRMRFPASLDVDGNGLISPLTDGLLTLRFEFGFTGAVLIGGAVDLAGCTRCTAPEIESYLEQQSSN